MVGSAMGGRWARGASLRPKEQLGLRVIRLVRRLWHRVSLPILLAGWLVTSTFAGAVGKMENSTRETTASIFGIWPQAFWRWSYSNS